MTDFSSLNFDEILDYPYGFEDGEMPNSLREYFQDLLTTLWSKGEGFSGKRPFGNSGWELDIHHCLATQEVLGGKVVLDEDGYVYRTDYDRKAYNKLVFALIEHCFKRNKE